MNKNPELSFLLCHRSEESILSTAQKVKEIVSKLTDSFEIVLVGNYIGRP